MVCVMPFRGWFEGVCTRVGSTYVWEWAPRGGNQLKRGTLTSPLKCESKMEKWGGGGVRVYHIQMIKISHTVGKVKTYKVQWLELHQVHCLPFLGFLLDGLRPLSIFRAFFTIIWPSCLFVTLPDGLSAPNIWEKNSRSSWYNLYPNTLEIWQMDLSFVEPCPWMPPRALKRALGPHAMSFVHFPYRPSPGGLTFS